MPATGIKLDGVSVLNAASASNPVQTLAPAAEESWPHYAEDEIAAVSAVLRSGRVNQWTGERVAEFEQAYSRKLGGGYSVALANGSLALELILRAFNVGPGDEVIVTPRSFVASAFCVCLVGARPVFADVDPESGCVTAQTIAPVLTSRTKAVIPVHLAGWPANMPTIMDLAQRSGMLVIEDCAQAHGALIGGKPVGSFGHAAAFSFCQDKIISTGGEGGLAWFRHPEAYELAWSFKDHGKNRLKMRTPASGSGYRFVHDSVGTNWRMTEIAATIGLLQLDKLAEWHRLRSRNADIWRDALEAIGGVRVPLPPPEFRHAYYKFYAYLDSAQDGETWRDRVLARANEEGLRVFSGSCSEIYREQAFSNLASPELRTARQLGQTSLMMEVHPTLESKRLAARALRLAELICESRA